MENAITREKWIELSDIQFISELVKKLFGLKKYLQLSNEPDLQSLWKRTRFETTLFHIVTIYLVSSKKRQLLLLIHHSQFILSST